jgi:hypothetical protein
MSAAHGRRVLGKSRSFANRCAVGILSVSMHRWTYSVSRSEARCSMSNNSLSVPGCVVGHFAPIAAQRVTLQHP